MREHGTYDMEATADLVRVVAVGPFNDEAMLRYARSFETLAKSLEGGPWAVFGIFRGESLFIPEAEDRLVEITRWRLERGMQSVACVLESTAPGNLVHAQLDRIYDRAGADYALFEEEAAAMRWLEERGFRFDSEAVTFRETNRSSR